MGTTAQKLQAILDSKAGIKDAIEEKGVTVGSAPLDEYASKIEQIPAPMVEAPENDVNFYDYDGFRVASYTIAEAKALTALPTPPTHEGLTFQEWNWTLADIQGYNRQFADIGAHYSTNDGKCHVKIDLPDDGLSIKINLNQTVTRDTTIEWGDGTSKTAVTQNDIGNIEKTHTYLQKGKYTIKLYKTDSTGIFKLNPTDSLYNYIYEINFGGNIGGIQTRGCYMKVTVPKTITSFVPRFEYSVIPQITVPKNAEWYNASNTSGFAYQGILCMPPSIALPLASSWCSANKRLIIPEFTTNGTIPNNAINTTTTTTIVSIPSNLAWASQASNVNYFTNQSSIRKIDIVQGWIPNVNIGFSIGYNVLPSAYVDFFTKLGALPDGVTRTITLGGVNLPKLTAEEKAIATNKGYTLA